MYIEILEYIRKVIEDKNFYQIKYSNPSKENTTILFDPLLMQFDDIDIISEYLNPLFEKIFNDEIFNDESPVITVTAAMINIMYLKNTPRAENKELVRDPEELLSETCTELTIDTSKKMEKWCDDYIFLLTESIYNQLVINLREILNKLTEQLPFNETEQIILTDKQSKECASYAIKQILIFNKIKMSHVLIDSDTIYLFIYDEIIMNSRILNLNFINHLDLKYKKIVFLSTTDYDLTSIFPDDIPDCKIELIILPENITHFTGKPLKYFKLPSTIVFIEDFFYLPDSKQIKQIDLTKNLNLKTISRNVAVRCNTLVLIELPDYIETIGDNFMYYSPKLNNVNISNCKQLSIIGNYFLNYTSILNNLDLSNCNLLSDIGNYFLYASNIINLDLSNCECLKKIGHTFCKHSSMLQILNLPNTPNITIDFKNFLQNCNCLVKISGHSTHIQEIKKIDHLKQLEIEYESIDLQS